MPKTLKTNHGEISFPTFFPDATRGVVKGGLDSRDLDQCQIEGLVINTMHLSTENQKDMHTLMNWQKPLITDSGGFQVMSLIHQNPKLGKLTDNEAIFIDEDHKRNVFTPERSIELQLGLGADILICLDDCTRPDADLAIQEKSVERTINWAKRCKTYFDQQTANLKNRPLLFAVVQGGENKELRTKCAEELSKLNFDGYCYGGFPVDLNKRFLTEILELVASILPDDKPKYAMGVGTPQNIVDCFKMGYDMFDCVIPTREARHKKLYLLNNSLENLDLAQEFYSTIYIQNSTFKDASAPLSKFCDCLTCQNYSKGYLHHLFKVKDMLALRLATIHNLRFYSMLMEALKKASK